MDIPALGARERTPDPRDFPLGAVTPSDSIPTVFMQDWSKIDVDMQAKIPACGSHAGSFLKNVQETIESGQVQRKSPRYLWDKIKLIDGFALEDGTDMLSIFKTLKSVGVCDLSLLPNDTSLSLEEYSNASITPAMDENAKEALIGNYGFTFYPTMQDIKAAIYKHKAILMLIRVGKEFWTSPSGVVSWAEADILPLRPPQTAEGGHFVVAYAYDENRIYFRNSWSKAWGRNGDGYFEANYLPFVVEIGTAFDVPKGRFNKDLYYKMANTDVYALQSFLVKNGFGNFTPTGFFGDKTLAAVKLFQAKYGIQTTGYVGVLTRAKLNTLV